MAAQAQAVSYSLEAKAQVVSYWLAAQTQVVSYWLAAQTLVIIYWLSLALHQASALSRLSLAVSSEVPST